MLSVERKRSERAERDFPRRRNREKRLMRAGRYSCARAAGRYAEIAVGMRARASFPVCLECGAHLLT